MLDDLPDADTPIADKGYDSNRFRQALAERRIEACIPGRSNRQDARRLRCRTLQAAQPH